MSVRPLRILTYARHDPYLCLLAKTGHAFDVHEPWVPALGRVRAWMPEFRPLPANARLVGRDEMLATAGRGGYDLVVCHDGTDLAASLAFRAPKILLLHTRLTWGPDEERAHGVTRDQFRAAYRDVLRRDDVHLAFVSETKRQSWDLGGPTDVIPPGIDLDDYRGWTGERAAALRVGNGILDNLTHGGTKLMYVTWGFPLQIIGYNDGPMPHARPSQDWDDLRAALRAHRVYVHTTEEAYEDGYNLALLEAMATGMPVIATANRTTPVVDGWNGFVSDDLGALRERLAVLLADHDLAARLGANARRTVADAFSLATFTARWNDLFARVVRAYARFDSASHAVA